MRGTVSEPGLKIIKIQKERSELRKWNPKHFDKASGPGSNVAGPEADRQS